MALALEENDFDFYLRFAKPLVLNLSEPDDRALAAAWVQKLRNEDVGDERLRTNYLKLLLFVLQRNKLIGTFATNPNTFQKLNEFPETQLKDIAKELLETEEEIRKTKRKEGGDNPPYATEHSGDLLEYAAAQEIPNFGVHAYYAISNDPLPFWDNTERAIFPRGAVSATNQSVCPSPSRPVGESSSEPALQERRVQFKSSGTSRQSPLRASPRPPEEERIPLTWGTNLIGVSEPTPHQYQPLIDDNVSDMILTADTQMVEDVRPPVYSGEPPFCGTEDAVGPDDFAPFDTMLEQYNEDEETCATSKIPTPTRTTHSRLPVCETGSRKSSLRKAGESKIPKPGTVICSTEADVFQIEPHITSPYLSPISQRGPDLVFFGESPDFVHDFKAPVLESIEELPMSPPRRGLFSPIAREEREDDFFLNGTPSFLEYSEFQTQEDAEEPLRTPSPKNPPDAADYSLESLPHLTPPPQRYDEYSLPLRTPSPPRPQRPCGTPVYDEGQIGDISSSVRIQSPRIPSPQTPRLLPERDEKGYSLTPPGFEDFAAAPCQKHDIFNSSQGDISLPLESPSPKLSTVTQKLFSSVFAEEDEFHLEDQPSFLDISEVGSGDELDEHITSPRPEVERQPDLLQVLGLTSDQMQAETRKPVEREYTPPVVTTRTLATKDIIDDFNKQNKERAFTPRPQSRISQPKRILPPGSIAAQFKQGLHAQDSQTAPCQPPCQPRPLPDHSRIARLKNRLVSKSKAEALPFGQSLERVPFPKITLEECKVFQAAGASLQGRTYEQVSSVPFPVQNSRMTPMQGGPSPRRSPEVPLRKSPGGTVTCSGRFIEQRTPSPWRRDFSDIGLDQDQFEPRTPPRRVELESSFQIGANESFTALGFESPPREYHSPEPIVSPDDKFGLPKRVEIEKLPPAVFHSPPHESPPTKSSNAPELAQKTVRLPASDYPPATVQTVERPRSTPPRTTTTGAIGGISELTTESLPGKISIQVDNILKKLEDSFETQWAFSELSEHPSNIFDDNFPIITSPVAESPVREFDFPSVDQIQADIDNILAQSPTLPSSASGPPKKECPFFERFKNSKFSQIGDEILPEEDYQSPRSSPGYQSPTEFFNETPPAYLYQPPEYFGSPELVSPEIYRSPTKPPAPARTVFYSPESPVESPRNFKNRLAQAEYFPYPERDRVAVRPRISTVRELPDYYHEKDMPFLQRVESAQEKWKKGQKKLKMPKVSLDNVFESPVTIPTMFEVEDITGLQSEIREYEKKYPGLLASAQESRPTSKTDYAVQAEFWDTPPDYKFKTKAPELVQICSPLSPCSPDRYIDEEHLPENLHSPVALSAEELELFNVTKGISKALDENIFELSGQEIQDYAEEEISYDQTLTTMTQLKEMGKRDPGDITAEQLPIYLVQLPPPSPEMKTPPCRKPVRPAVSPTSPILQYSTLSRAQASQLSPPESPTTFRCRTYPTGEPQVDVLSVKTRAKKIPVRKQLPSPKIETVIEETEGYNEDNVQFRTSSQMKFPEQRQIIRTTTFPMKDIRESSGRIPFYTEVHDPTGTMIAREEVEKRLKSFLPQVEQDYLEPKSILDTSPSRDLPEPLRPEAKICGWKSPPQYEFTPLHSAKPYQVSPPEEPETLEGEIIPTDIIFSPPHITPTRARTPYTPKFEDLNIPSPPPDGLIIETIEIVDDQILDDELFPEELAILNSIQRTPPPRGSPLQKFSRLGSPESPVNLHIGTHNASEPPYLSKPSMNVGSKKVKVKRRSDAPRVSKIIKASEYMPEEHVPFLSQVVNAKKVARPERIRVQRSPQMEPLREVPVDVPNWLEIDDDKTGFKKIRKEIESRYSHLPEIAQKYPQDMFDSTVPDEWNRQYTELDTDLPPTLPIPLQSTTKVEGWKTPPQYHQSPQQGVRPDSFQVQYPPDLEDDIMFEGIPTEFRFTSPSKSPTLDTDPQFKREITPVRRSPRSPVDHFEQLQKQANAEPQYLDSEMIVEDEEIFDLSISKTPSPRRRISARRSRLTEGDKLLMKQVSRSAFKELMQEEEGVSPSPCQRTKPSRSTKILTADSPRIAQAVRLSSIPYEQIEELIYDVPDPGLPIRERTMELQEFTSPPWSPGLPEHSQYVEDFFVDDVPDEILHYKSPKEQKTPSPKKPNQTPPISPQRRSSKPVARNLFDEFQETELLEDVNLPDELLVSSPSSPRTPPTPPRIEEYYDVEASPEGVRTQSPRQLQSPKKSPCRAVLESPENLAENLRRHRYTDRRYDLRRDLMTKSVQIKNKKVPLRKSRPPGVCTIVETIEEGSNIPPRGALRKHEITEAKPIPSRFPAYVPQTLDFDSPPRGEQIVLTDTFAQLYPQQAVGISDVSPPRMTDYPEDIVAYEEFEIPDFPEMEYIPQEFVYSPQRCEGISRRQEHGGSSPNSLRQDCASINTVHGSSPVRRTCPGMTARSVQPQSFALPMADYYGSPGRVYVRTPTWNRQRSSPRAAKFTSRCNPKGLGTGDVASGYQ